MSSFSALRTTMVDTQVRPSDVTKLPIIQAMLAVPREEFVPNALRDAAYVGNHISLGASRVILDARTFAKMLDALAIGPQDSVLDVGCGLGYSAAVLGHLAKSVVAVEDNAEMAAHAKSVLTAQGCANVSVEEGALSSGSPKNGPFQAILINGAVEQVPVSLLTQLNDGGRIAAIFMTGALGECRLGTKVNGTVNWRLAFNASAPLLPGFSRVRAFAL
jgi:protein-L-isoaspartate(D-aspartate) O-methyltransferase